MKVYMMMNVPANFHLIWTKNKEIAGGGLMWPPPAQLFDRQKFPAFVGLKKKKENKKLKKHEFQEVQTREGLLSA